MSIISSSLVLTVLYQNGDNLTTLMKEVIALKKEKRTVTLRVRHQKAEPVLQVYEASFSYCPQDCIFFTSRVNVVPKLKKELLN